MPLSLYRQLFGGIETSQTIPGAGGVGLLPETSKLHSLWTLQKTNFPRHPHPGIGLPAAPDDAGLSSFLINTVLLSYLQYVVSIEPDLQQMCQIRKSISRWSLISCEFRSILGDMAHQDFLVYFELAFFTSKRAVCNLFIQKMSSAPRLSKGGPELATAGVKEASAVDPLL